MQETAYMYNLVRFDMCIYLWNCLSSQSYFLPLWNPSLLFFSCPGNHLLAFCHCWCFHFLQFYINLAVCTLFFLIWLLLFSNGYFVIYPYFPFVLFLSSFCWVLFHCMDLLLFMYPFTSLWTFEPFQFLAISNKVTINIHMHVLYGSWLSFLLSKHLALGTIMGCKFLNFFRNCWTVSQSGCTILRSIIGLWLPVVHILTYLVWLTYYFPYD